MTDDNQKNMTKNTDVDDNDISVKNETDTDAQADVQNDAQNNEDYVDEYNEDEEEYDDEYDEEGEEDYEEEVEINITPPDDSNESSAIYSANRGLIETIRRNDLLESSLSSNKRQLFISILLNFCLGFVIAVLLFAFSLYPKTKFIPTKDNGAICEVSPENNPNINDITISEFAKTGLLSLYTFDYINYEDEINESLGRYFTPKGRGAAVQALENAGIFEKVEDNAWTFKSSTTQTPKIEKKGVNNQGKTYWIVTFPIVVDIYSGEKSPIDSQHHMASVRVVADTANSANPTGLGISSATLEPIK